MVMQLVGGLPITPQFLHTCRWSFTKLHHLPQAHASSRETRVMFDGVHQPLRFFPRHIDNSGPSACVSLWGPISSEPHRCPTEGFGIDEEPTRCPTKEGECRGGLFEFRGQNVLANEFTEQRLDELETPEVSMES